MSNKAFCKVTGIVFFLFVSVATMFAGGRKEVTSAQLVETESTKEVEKPDVVKVAALNGPSGIPMAYLFENHPELDGVESTFETAATADVLLPKILKGEIDISILPTNAAAKVYTKNKGALVMGGVVGQGMLFVITKDASVKTLADLKGKTVSVAGQGATPEYITRFLLDKNGIAVNGGDDSVTLDFSITSAELAAAVISDKAKYAIVPEPFATVASTKDASILRAINIQEEFKKVFSGLENYPMTVVVIRSEFANKYPETVRAFLKAYNVAIDWTNANPQEAGQLVQKYTLGLQAPIAAKAIPNAAFVYQSATDAKPAIEQLLNVFMSFAPESIGNQLPDNGFYFN